MNEYAACDVHIIACIVKPSINCWRTREFDLDRPNAISSKFKHKVSLGAGCCSVEPSPGKRTSGVNAKLDYKALPAFSYD